MKIITDYCDEFAFQLSGYHTTHSSVPEPSTLILFGLGMIGFAGLRRKKGKK